MANSKLVTVDVLQYNNEKIKEQLNKKVNIEQGVDNKGKLLGVDNTGNVALIDIPESGDKNTIENISVNGTTLTPDTNKNVDVIVPTLTSDLTNDSNFVADENYVHTDNNFSTDEKEKLANLENYDDSSLVERIDNLETNTHIHDNKDILDDITASYTTEEKQKLESLENYDDTTLSDRVAETESAITVLNGTGDGSVQKTIDNALNKFATDLSDDGVVNTYKELVDYAAQHTSDIAEIVADIADNTEAINNLETRIDTVETNLSGHTVKTDVPENAIFTDTVYDDTELVERIQTIEDDYLTSTDKTEITDSLSSKLDVKQSVEQAGKILTVADDGNITFTESTVFSGDSTSSSTYIINCAVGLESDGSLIVDNYDGDFTKIKQTIANGGKVELRTNFNGYDYILEPSKIEEDYIAFNTVNKNENITIQVSEYGVYTASYIDLNSAYTTLDELGLTSEATIDDVRDALPVGGTCMIRTDAFSDLTQFKNLQYGYLKITKTEQGMSDIWLNDVTTEGNLYYGKQNSGQFSNWISLSKHHRIVTQADAGYFKFLAPDAYLQPLNITVTDQFGGCVVITGSTSTDTYKHHRAIRLSNGNWSNEDPTNAGNNKIEGLYYYDKYYYLKVGNYTTVTITSLIEPPALVETLDTTIAEEIPIKSVFDIIRNDGYADPSIMVIGDAVSADGVIQTLDSLGFTGDVMTWDTGEYRVSHVAGITNLPAEITEEKPGFRLAHYDLKKWGNNHNPYTNTYGVRQSILHYKGNVFCRYIESGDTAGVLITDTGWQRIIVENSKTDPYSCTGYTVLTGTEDLFTLAPGHYASTKADTAYNYPITDSSNVTAHIYVLGHLNDPANNKGYRIILYFDNKGRMYRINEWCGSFSNGWKNIEDSKALVTNAQNFKIDITKNNSYWYGMFTFNFVYGTTPCEITVTITDKVYYTITKGQNIVSAITYTQNGANYVFGIALTATVYGTQIVEMPSEFGTINSLTAETYAGDTTATCNGYSARGYTTLTELGLDGTATIANVLSKMYTGQIALLDVSLFDNYETIFPYKDSNDLYSAVLIIKSANNTRNYVKWFRKDGSREALASYSSNNVITGWFDYALKDNSSDTSWTTATVNSGIGYATNSSGGYTTKYAVKNNVVYINSNIICNTVKDSGYDTFITGLPAPSTNLFFTLQPDVYGNAPIIAQIDTSGNLKLRNGTAGKTYTVSISYPII